MKRTLRLFFLMAIGLCMGQNILYSYYTTHFDVIPAASGTLYSSHTATSLI